MPEYDSTVPTEVRAWLRDAVEAEEVTASLTIARATSRSLGGFDERLLLRMSDRI